MSSAVALLEAIEAGELALHYQGIYDLRPRRLVGFEALIRWRHPEHGLLWPGSFLPSDMGGGLGWALTNFVLEEAVRECAGWQRRGQRLGVSVNISPGPLSDELLPDRVGAVLDRYGLPPHLLTVEITEHRCAVDPAGIAEALRRLAACGVRLSLDDFGTGESTLSRLREVRFDEIKIDRSFITAVASDPTDRHIVEFVTLLGHQLGCSVVAEGIEDTDALAVLEDLGVDRGQGFLLHRPTEVSTDCFIVLP
jgi:EAL domain-containing protein (putative c-di-GMP-specific phosphodiesterase class I)